jgi:hypothetical protein
MGAIYGALPAKTTSTINLEALATLLLGLTPEERAKLAAMLIGDGRRSVQVP